MAADGRPPTGPIVWLDAPAAADAGQTGEKAARLARLRRGGLPVPDGFCVAASAYRAQVAVTEARTRGAGGEAPQARRRALGVRLGLLRAPLDPALAERLDAAYRRLAPEPNTPVVVRSSALAEDTAVATFAGQLETFLGVVGREDLVTAVRACWASLWARRAIEYAETRGLDPADNAMAVLVQRLVPARVSGGALSTPDGRLVLTATWGLGPAIAQGLVAPDRYVLRCPRPVLERVEPGHKERLVRWADGVGLRLCEVPAPLVAAPCLSEAEALGLAGLVLKAEEALGMLLEVEWALDEGGFQLLQARPVVGDARHATGQPSRNHTVLRGQPAGAGRAIGRACVVRAEIELDRVRPGDILVTKVPGPALAAVLPRVTGIVAELGGSTTHLATLARERGIPAVLGVRDATRRLADGSLVLVDGARGTVHPVPARRRERVESPR